MRAAATLSLACVRGYEARSVELPVRPLSVNFLPLLLSRLRFSGARAAAAALVALLVTLMTSRAHAVRSVIEIQDEEQGWVEGKVVRRLVSLELADIQLPKEKAAHGPAFDGVYLRVLRLDTQMVVELWYRAELQAQRRLTSTGGAPVRARRIALAAEEMARRLRDKRLVEERRNRRRSRAQAVAAATYPVVIPAELTLSSAIQGATIGTGSAWLVGPQLGFALRAQRGPRLAITAAQLVGFTPGLAAASELLWWELALSPGYAFTLSPTTSGHVGLSAAAAALHVNGSRQTLDGAWSARAGLDVGGSLRLSARARMTLGAEAGFVLRPVRVEAPSGLASLNGLSSERLGGTWLGVKLGLTLLP